MTTNYDNLREEIIEHLEQYYFDPDNSDDPTNCTDDIIKIIVPWVDKKIKQCESDMKSPTATMEETGWDCLNSKKKAFEEVKTMLVKK